MSPAPQRCFPYYICTTNWPLLSPAPKSSFPYYICTTNWPLLSPAPKSSFPYYICTTNWPLLSPALKSSFPYHICTKVLRLLRNLQFEVHKVLRLPRSLHFKVCAFHRGSQSAVPATKSARRGSPSVQKSRFTAPVTKSELTTMSKVRHLPRKLHFEVKQLRSLASVTKSRL